MPADAWLFDVDLSVEEIAALYPLLDRDERTRSMQFRFARDRDRFIARRGRLRHLLASYLGEAAQDIAFRQNDCGKPLILGDDGLQFSLSHSHGLALCAISWDHAVGCNLEWRDESLACRKTADRLFSACERADLDRFPSDRWIEGFYALWTRKAAFAKAFGRGLPDPLDGVDMSVAPGAPAELPLPAGRWSMHGFAPRPGFQAAVVVEGVDQAVRVRGMIPRQSRSAA